MRITDIRSFANLFGQGAGSSLVKKATQQFRGIVDICPEENYGEIRCYQYGFDIQFSDDVSLPTSGNQEVNCWRVDSVRFFSPAYCTGKEIVPYSGKLVNDLAFPLKQNEVRSKLGQPSRSSAKPNRYDEYDYNDCSVRFTYPRKRDDVMFASLEVLPSFRSQYGLGALIDPETRSKQLSGRRRRNWIQRLDVYQAILGDVRGVFPADHPDIDVLVYQQQEDCFTLVTSGMSDRRMYVPPAYEDACRLELVMYVSAVEKQIVERLVRSASFPFSEKTYLGHGDTINWKEPIVPGSLLTADLIVFSIIPEHRDLPLAIDDDSVQLLWNVPISAAELKYKKSRGIDALLAVFDQVDHPLVLNVFRESYI